jgi:hypothetical protein
MSTSTARSTRLCQEDAREVVAFLARRGIAGKRVLKQGEAMPLEERFTYYLGAAKHFRRVGKEWPLYRVLPVYIRTFVENDYFLNRKGVIYPAVMAALAELNSGNYIEAVLTGGIDHGKITCPCR